MAQNQLKIASVLIIIIAVALGLYFLACPEKTRNGDGVVDQGDLPFVPTPVMVETPVPTPTPDPEPNPESHLLDVPFTSQAPFGNWGMPYQEACEETAALVVHYYYEGKKFTPDLANREILAIVDFENEHLGFYKDTTAEETADWIKAYWGYDRVEVITDPTVEEIKRNVAEGRPVIVPTAGRELGNPNFTPPGPVYHFIVIRGYTPTSFITNDVGTRLGEKYTYKIETVMDAMHDWNDGKVERGAKKIIVIWPDN